MMKSASLLFLLFCLLASANADSKTISISKSAVNTALDTASSLMRIYLDTMGTFKNAGTDASTWHHDGSYFQLPTGQRITIPIPKLSRSFVFRRYELHIENYISDKIKFSRHGSQWRLRLTGHDNRFAFIIGCINRRKDKPCSAHIFKHTAGISDFHVDVYFQTVFDGPKMTLKPTDVDLDFKYDIHSTILDMTVSAIGSLVGNLKTHAKTMAKEKILETLDRNEVKQHLTFDLNNLLFNQLMNALPGPIPNVGDFINDHVKLTSVSETTSTYRFRFEYPTIVLPNAVESVSLSPIVTDVTSECPYNYGFKATIKSNSRASGTAFLELSTGETFRSSFWNMPSGGEKTSTVAMAVDGAVGEIAKVGFARIVVRYTAFPNTVYEKKSGYVFFRARCSSNDIDDVVFG